MQLIADEILRLRTYLYVVAGGAGIFGHPVSRQLIQMNINVPDQGTLLVARKNHPYHSMCVDLTNFDEVDAGQLNLTLIKTWPAFVTMQAADAVRKHLPDDRRPLFEFLRHVRNAVAHDGVFDIRKVSFPALFQGYEITAEMNGMRLWEFLEAGDLLALLEEVECALRQPQGKGNIERLH